MLKDDINVDHVFQTLKTGIQKKISEFFNRNDDNLISDLAIRKEVKYEGRLKDGHNDYLYYDVAAYNNKIDIFVEIINLDKYYHKFTSINGLVSLLTVKGIETELELFFNSHDESNVDSKTRLTRDITSILLNESYSNITFTHLDIHLNYLKLGNIDVSHLGSLFFTNYSEESKEIFYVDFDAGFKHNLESIVISLGAWKDFFLLLHKSSITFASISCFSTVGLEVIKIPLITTLDLATYSSLSEVLNYIKAPKLREVNYLKI